MDNADGKQARKTGNSSTLGMLFDHGFDTIMTLILATTTLHIAGLKGFQYHYSMAVCGFGFYLTTLVQFDQKKIYRFVGSSDH